MDRATFWSVIDESLAASEGEWEAQRQFLRDVLSDMRPDEIVGFERQSRSLIDGAFREDLQAAVELVEGICVPYRFSFEEFRLWLVSRGECVYQMVLDDPDSLADIDLRAAKAEIEEFGRLAKEAWDVKVGESGFFARLGGRGHPRWVANDESFLPGEPFEVRWKRRFPRLFAKYRQSRENGPPAITSSG